jgi:hypothetical protein
VTPEIAEFIERAIDTIQQLEILFLLRGKPDRVWRVGEIAAEVRMTTTTAALNVSALHAFGLLVVEAADGDGYRYEPHSITLHAGVEGLVAAHETDPVSVLTAVFNKPPRALRTFADALLLRRPPD